MIELDLELPDEKIGWLGTVEENIHPDETFRLHFSGILSTDENISMVMVELPKGIKLRPNSRMLRRDYERRRLIGTLPEIPMWENVHPGEDFVDVDFDAEIREINKDGIVLLLPDSYSKEDNAKNPSDNKELRSFTFKTNHVYLLDLIAKIVEDRPIVNFYGPLSSICPEDSKVEISIPVKMEAKTQSGGRVSLSSQGIILAVVSDIPGWEEQAEELGMSGYLFTNFEAVITRVQGDEVTVSLPKFYR